DRFVRLNRKYKRALRPVLHRNRRNHGAVLVHLKQQPDVHELVWPENIVLIVENSFQPSGSGRLINLVIDRQQLAGCQLGLIISAVASTSRVPLRMCWATVGRLSSGSVNSTDTGWSCVITSMGFVSAAWTIFPTSTSRMPIRPLMGAVMWQ